MPVLDFEGQQRLAVLQGRHGGTRFREVAPVVGTDRETGLDLTLDAARRVADVRVPDAGLLRTPALLRAAVRSAFQDADLARARASREAAGERPPAGDDLDVTPLLRPTSLPRRDIARRTRATVASGVPARSAPTLATTGRSGNGYLTVTLGPTGVVEDVDADPGWLAGARGQFLETALVQAFHEATRNQTATT